MFALRPIVPSLLRQNRDFRRFWIGQSVSLIGDQISALALPLLAVLLLGATPAQMGYLAAVTLAPNLLSLHAGAWVDRFGRRRKVMIAADIGRAALLASIPIAYAVGVLAMAQLYVVGLGVGFFNVFFNVAGSSFAVALVPRERFIESSSLTNGSRAMSDVVGPGIGGALVQLLSAPVAIAADAASFVLSAFSLAIISPQEPPASKRGPGQVAAGIRFIFASGIMRAALAATATINFFNFAYSALLILYASRYLHVAPGTLGIVFGSGAVGGLIGAAVTAGICRRIGIGPAFVSGCVLFPAPLLLVPLAGGPSYMILSLLFLASFGGGFGVMVLDISIGTIFAALIPPELRSRVAGAYMVVNYGVRPLGSLAGGLLGSLSGPHATLWVAAAGGLAGVLWLLPSPLMKLRALPDTVLPASQVAQ